jgi:hypothetical protein
VGLTLWKCSNRPSGAKDTWGSQGCSIVKDGSNRWKPPTNNEVYTTYAPPTGDTGAKGAGWYAGTAITTGYNLNQQLIIYKEAGSAWVHLTS